MKSKFYFIFLILTNYFLYSCVSVKYVSEKSILNIKDISPYSWSINDCNSIINHYKITNSEGAPFAKKQSVFIEALPLNNDVIVALIRKETIEKRLSNIEFRINLKAYLDAYTSFTLDTSSSEIVISDSNFTKGCSFKIYLENISDPFKPIFLEDGYSYFFLENKKGDFSRVNEVSGLYAEDYIQLDGYLNVVITFSPFASNGKRLFSSKDLNESYKLVFNGLQKDPIIIEWNTK